MFSKSVFWKRALLPLLLALTLPFGLTGAQAQAGYTFNGTIIDNYYAGVPGAQVYVMEYPSLNTITNPDGTFTLSGLPANEYIHLSERIAGGCYYPLRYGITMYGDTNWPWEPVGNVYDAAGHYCQKIAPAYIEAGTALPLTRANTSAPVTLPFAFPFYGQTYETAYVSTNGYLNFLADSTTGRLARIPSPSAPNAVIAPFAGQLGWTSGASVRTELVGSSPDQKFVIEWRGISPAPFSPATLDFEAVLYENGMVEFQYRNIDNNLLERGSRTVTGIENQDGTIGLQFSRRQSALRYPEEAIRFSINTVKVLTGVVTDAVTGRPIAGAQVTAYIEQIGEAKGTITDRDGSYYLPLDGRYHLNAWARGYGTSYPNVTLDMRSQTTDMTLDFALTRQFRLGVNAGGWNYRDSNRVKWSMDRAYYTGSWGYTATDSHAYLTHHAITGTSDDRLYQTERVGPGEYRFDNLPAGVYDVDMLFAELNLNGAGQRVFDVNMEGMSFLTDHDIYAEVGGYAADRHTFRVAVTDGQLNIVFVPHDGSAPPVISGIYITQE